MAGENRYLSGDLLDLLVGLLDFGQVRTKRERTFYASAFTNVHRFPNGAFYAPGAAYPQAEVCTLLRNPHIARNEEIQLSCYDDKNNMRQFYFHQLTDVVMVNSNMLAAEQLGGADYDGDMVKTIADPIINACVRGNYDIARFEKYKSLENRENIPLLMIPAAEPRIRSAHDWEARFEAVRDTFSSRVGQICNAALDRSIIAYNENSDDEERQRCRERFLLEWLPEFEELFDLLTDFRFGGHRVLWDILLDIDQENTAQDRKRLNRDGDSPAFAAMMEAYQKKTASQSYRDAVSAKCRELMEQIVKPVIAVRYVVALDKRGLLWKLLPDAVLPNVLEVRHAE